VTALNYPKPAASATWARSMLTDALLAAYVIVAGWFFWVGTRNRATVLQAVGPLWPVVAALLLAFLARFGGDDTLPEDA
jgi:hypothetical protein